MHWFQKSKEESEGVEVPENLRDEFLTPLEMLELRQTIEKSLNSGPMTQRLYDMQIEQVLEEREKRRGRNEK